jgi:hypothetical protein
MPSRCFGGAKGLNLSPFMAALHDGVDGRDKPRP